MRLAAGFSFLFDAYAFAVGACIGSFLNVVIARLPQGKSLVRPSSACPRCGQPIAWYDNVPLLSWLLLRGRCRRCGARISPRYPIVELLAALLAFAIFRRFGLTAATFGFIGFAAALIALAYIDLDTWLLPHEITWPLLASGLVSPLWNRSLTFLDAFAGAGAGFVLFAGIVLLGEKVLRRELMGWGDVWLLAGIGAWLGWRALLPVILLSAMQGSAVGLILIARRPAQKVGPSAQDENPPPMPTATSTSTPTPTPTPTPPPQDVKDDWVPPKHAVPFGPFLALGALEQLLLGDALANAYLRLLRGWA